MKYRNTKKTWLQSKITLVVTLTLLGFVLTSWGKVVYRKHLIDKEIEALKQEVSELESENQNMDKLIEYLASDSYLEKTAREKFNLQREGEKVVVVTDKDNTQTPEEADLKITSKETSELAVHRQNWSKWWSYFFTN